MISGIHGSVIAAGLAVLLAWTTTGNAAEHRLAGRWRNSSAAVGIIQLGQAAFVFGKDGWAVCRPEPGTAGMLAIGEGSWTYDARPVPATITVGEHDGHLYIVVAPMGASVGSEIKMVLEPVGSEMPPDKAWPDKA